MKIKFVISTLLNSGLVSLLANSFTAIKSTPGILYAAVPAFLLLNIFAGTLIQKVENIKVNICKHGTVLLYSFYISIIASVIFHIWLWSRVFSDDRMTFIWSAVLCFAVNFVVFWNGIISVYITSNQLGIKWRTVGLICGMIPVANLIALYFILKTTTGECLFEMEKDEVNKQRKDDRICATKYPILLVHGVFFRDTKYFNYWGRIPRELEINGAKIYYGNQPSAASVADSAIALKTRIETIIAETGAEKINIIAHSKGGLDCRYAISKLGAEKLVASLTTINTPHRGCLFADYLLDKISVSLKMKVADTYNFALKKVGEENSDFLAAVGDLTDSRCSQLNAEMPTPENIYCQSVGSVLKMATGSKFPLNFSYHIVKHFSGANDGLVSENSFEWGEKYTLLTPSKDRGISHGDMIDLNRENIPGFDVREFYVQLVSDLKNRGL